MGAGASKRNSPPKHAIANGFAFGSIPKRIQITGPEECPIPRIIEDPANANNTDEDEDGIEPTFEGATFHFTSGHEPDDNTGVYRSTQNFIQAMLQRTMPTLLVQR